MATSISICSNALLMLGAKTINSFDEDSDRAKLVATLWPSFLAWILRNHYWNCAKKRVILSPEVETPAFDWAYQFILPADWVRTLNVGERVAVEDFEQMGNRILFNSNVLYLTYISDSVTQYDNELVNLLEVGMAARMAYAITQSASLQEARMQEFKLALRSARAVDGMDEPPLEFRDSVLLNARY